MRYRFEWRFSNLVGHAYSWGINTPFEMLLLENTRSWQVLSTSWPKTKRILTTFQSQQELGLPARQAEKKSGRSTLEVALKFTRAIRMVLSSSEKLDVDVEIGHPDLVRQSDCKNVIWSIWSVSFREEDVERTREHVKPKIERKEEKLWSVTDCKSIEGKTPTREVYFRYFLATPLINCCRTDIRKPHFTWPHIA